MYRRNTASQTVYAVLVNATTGAAETSGVAVAVSKDGGASAAGTGTLAHITEGLWSYTFSAGELDATAVGYVFHKAGAVPTGGTIRTTQANPDDAAALGLTRLDEAVSAPKTLTPAERTTLAAAIEAGLIDEASGGAIRQAIVERLVADLPDLDDLSLGAIAAAVWGNGTRTLTSGANIVLAKGAGVTGFNDLDAVGMRAAVGLAAADLDARLAGIAADAAADATVGGYAAGQDPATLLDARLDALDAAIAGIDVGGGAVTLDPAGLDGVVIEVGVPKVGGGTVDLNLRQALALILDAACYGILTGADTDTVTIKTPDGTATRGVVSTDPDGNRTAVRVTPPA